MYHAAAGQTFTWRLLSDAGAEAAEALQQKTFETCYNDLPEYVCTRCRHQNSFLQMRGHLRIRSVCLLSLVCCVKQFSGNSHSVDNPEVEEDYVLRVDASMDQPPFPLMLPHSPPEVIELDEDEPASKPLKYSGRSIVIDD